MRKPTGKIVIYLIPGRPPALLPSRPKDRDEKIIHFLNAPHHRTEGLLKEVCSDPRRAHLLTLPPHVCPSHFAQPLPLP